MFLNLSLYFVSKEPLFNKKEKYIWSIIFSFIGYISLYSLISNSNYLIYLFLLDISCLSGILIFLPNKIFKNENYILENNNIENENLKNISIPVVLPDWSLNNIHNNEYIKKNILYKKSIYTPVDFNLKYTLNHTVDNVIPI